MDDKTVRERERATDPGVLDRRRFLQGAAAAALAAGCGGEAPAPEPSAAVSQAGAMGPLGGLARAERALLIQSKSRTSPGRGRAAGSRRARCSGADRPPRSWAPTCRSFCSETCPTARSPLPSATSPRLQGDDRLTGYEEWLRIQDGGPPARPTVLDRTRRYLRNGRDRAE